MQYLVCNATNATVNKETFFKSPGADKKNNNSDYSEGSHFRVDCDYLLVDILYSPQRAVV